MAHHMVDQTAPRNPTTPRDSYVPAIPAVLGTAVSTGLAWLTDRRSGVLLVVPAAVSVAMIVGGAVLVWYVFGFGPRNL